MADMLAVAGFLDGGHEAFPGFGSRGCAGSAGSRRDSRGIAADADSSERKYLASAGRVKRARFAQAPKR